MLLTIALPPVRLSVGCAPGGSGRPARPVAIRRGAWHRLRIIALAARILAAPPGWFWSPRGVFTRFFAELRGAWSRSRCARISRFSKRSGRAVTDDPEGFYFLARAAPVKDERHVDRFDRVFAAAVFGGLLSGDRRRFRPAPAALPEDWLRKLAERFLTPPGRARRDREPGGFDALMETLARRLAEQKGRHEGGSKWIGTAGTSPFGACGWPIPRACGSAGTKPPPARGRVWDRRDFANLDDGVELGTAASKLALRRLRRWARDGAAGNSTFPPRSAPPRGRLARPRHPARKAAQRGQGAAVPRCRRSMDPISARVEELFSAARAVGIQASRAFLLPQLLCEGVWRDNRRCRGRPDRQPSSCAPMARLSLHSSETRRCRPTRSPNPGANEHWNA